MTRMQLSLVSLGVLGGKRKSKLKISMQHITNKKKLHAKINFIQKKGIHKINLTIQA
jgi:hypothetical protein